MSKTNAAEKIGNTIRQARLDRGFTTRADLVETRPIKGKLTQEGLRKIEMGERIPRLETLERLTTALGVSPRVKKELERMALEKNIERATRQAGNVDVKFKIDGKAVEIAHLPPKRKTEAYVRKTVDDLLAIAKRLGMADSPEDETYFRQHARGVLLRNLP